MIFFFFDVTALAFFGHVVRRLDGQTTKEKGEDPTISRKFLRISRSFRGEIVAPLLQLPQPPKPSTFVFQQMHVLESSRVTVTMSCVHKVSILC